MKIDEADLETQIQVLMASAAIPFGVVESIDIAGEVCVDGGVVDNFPVLPALGNGIDEIFVLSLQSSRVDYITGLMIDREERAKRLLRLIELSEIRLPDESLSRPVKRINVPPSVVPYCQFAEFPEIFVFSPMSPIGGLWKGTVRFDSGYAQELVRKGYQDGMSAFAPFRAG